MDHDVVMNPIVSSCPEGLVLVWERRILRNADGSQAMTSGKRVHSNW
eukprot:CAMPEP_0197439924 /NCGR_PEP_ID=MMETSP1175-20131217/6558_1 /TAXON_ID=1003142 /ORGANISM="Triceratium dubium, Strain CCMP147" /LENGTH=46 /DNA_ID= /DNA_START= /DNA_END= /DNA_ORIENTATION=